MTQILDMMSRWSPIGQGLFLLILAGMFFTSVSYGWFYLIVLLRGWPPVGSPVPRLPSY